VHANCAGIALCEIQQNCDITYRRVDYGRPRELHIEEAAAIADLSVTPVPSLAVKMIRGNGWFARILRNGAREITASKHSGHPIAHSSGFFSEGNGSIGNSPFRTAQVWLVPAGTLPSISARVRARPRVDVPALR